MFDVCVDLFVVLELTALALVAAVLLDEDGIPFTVLLVVLVAPFSTLAVDIGWRERRE